MSTIDSLVALGGAASAGEENAGSHRGSTMLRRAVAAGETSLDELEAKALLAAYGIPVPSGSLARSCEEAVRVATDLRRPVAMKAIGPSIRHKTEARLVALSVQLEDVEETYRSLLRRAGEAARGVLVEEMLAAEREFLVGMRRDEAFGPVVAFGLGGVLTEALADIAFALAPVGASEAAELPMLIRARGLLGRFRGYPAVDRARLSEIIRSIGRMAMENPEIAEIDVNPLLTVGGRPVAADALVILSPARPRGGGGRRHRPDLRSVLAPSSVAIVGASDELTRWGGSALKNILDGGYDGTIYPVNPRGGMFFGLPVATGIDELPEAPDLALLAVGASQTAAVVEQCGRRGIPAAVAIAAGFSETGDEGAKLERELAEAAERNSVTLIGPNCMGLIANERRLHATGFIAMHPSPSRLSLVSQSGNLGVQLAAAAERRGIGLDKFIGVGNEAQVDVVDVLDYLRDEERTDCVLAYIEGIEDGRRLYDVARATTSQKPVVVLRGGTTESGGRAAASHTGAMAGSGAVFEAAARGAGVITCSSSQEALDLTCALAHLPLPNGRRVGVITNGGGVGVLMADEIARHGLSLAELPPELIAELDEVLPPFWSRRNPMDLVASAGGDVAPRVLRAVAGCEAIDALVVMSVLGVADTGNDVRLATSVGDYEGLSFWESAFMQLVSELMERTGKPIINVPDNPLRASLYSFGERYSPVVLSSPAAAARALDRMAWYADYLRGSTASQPQSRRPKDVR
jgi:acyl-CoA synthetase (NDP forming)